MAGGDGSQAIVAAIAAERGLPYACIPAGTRNHFALDLGVDRDDVVGALDALVDGGERVVDLADVNGRVFVNNVSLGVYAAAVQKTGYRGAKLRTLLDTVPEVLGTHDAGDDLWFVDGAGQEQRAPAVLLVSNNRYRFGRAAGAGSRPRMDAGALGVALVGAPARTERALREWTAPSFEVDAAGAVPAGIDGEAARLEPPLVFRTHPAALQVRIARAHPGRLAVGARTRHRLGGRACARGDHRRPRTPGLRPPSLRSAPRDRFDAALRPIAWGYAQEGCSVAWIQSSCASGGRRCCSGCWPSRRASAWRRPRSSP
jgi:hypothetical protein